jgi:hypothetical protein
MGTRIIHAQLRHTKWLAPLTLAAVLGAGRAARAGDGPDERYLDVRLSPTVGYFVYSQSVDGGYYINGQPYDLLWSGMQLHVLAELQMSIPSHPDFSAGLGGAFMYAPGPTARDGAGTVSVNLNEPAFGGYAGAAGTYWLFGRARFNVLLGYGGAGISNGEGFGGYGAVVSTGAEYLVRSGGLVGGIGIHLLAMFLSYGAKGSTRGESGRYFAVMLAPSGDWVPSF